MTSLTTIDPHLKIELCTIQEERETVCASVLNTWNCTYVLWAHVCDEITCSLELIVRTNICTESNGNTSLCFDYLLGNLVSINFVLFFLSIRKHFYFLLNAHEKRAKTIFRILQFFFVCQFIHKYRTHADAKHFSRIEAVERKRCKIGYRAHTSDSGQNKRSERIMCAYFKWRQKCVTQLSANNLPWIKSWLQFYKRIVDMLRLDQLKWLWFLNFSFDEN